MPLKLVISKNAVPDFRHGEIFTVIGKYFPHLNYDDYFFIHNICKNRKI